MHFEATNTMLGVNSLSVLIFYESATQAAGNPELPNHLG
jgi:hypothetical protein